MYVWVRGRMFVRLWVYCFAVYLFCGPAHPTRKKLTQMKANRCPVPVYCRSTHLKHFTTHPRQNIKHSNMMVEEDTLADHLRHAHNTHTYALILHLRETVVICTSSVPAKAAACALSPEGKAKLVNDTMAMYEMDNGWCMINIWYALGT